MGCTQTGRAKLSEPSEHGICRNESDYWKEWIRCYCLRLMIQDKNYTSLSTTCVVTHVAGPGKNRHVLNDAIFHTS